MNLKVSIKILIVFASLILTLLIFNVNTIKAETYKNLTYRIVDENNKEIAITGVTDKEEAKELIIPKTINGYNVISVEAGAFYNCYNLTKIEMPDSINVIGEYAFSGCTNLEKVIIPSSVNKIENNAFYNTSYNTIIMVEKGSYAEQYAINNNKLYKYDENNILIRDCTVMKEYYYDYAYTGKEIKPKVIVKYKGEILKEDVDYELQYENNIEIGTATIKTTGKGNYVGINKNTFKIRERNIADDIIDKIPDTINIDIKEIEYEKSDDELFLCLKKILQNEKIEFDEDKDINGHNIIIFQEKVNDQKIAICSRGSKLYLNFHKGLVAIAYYNEEENSIYNTIVEKDINLVYNNTKDYNLKDEQYVKELNIKHKSCFECTLDFFMKRTEENSFYKIIGEYYTNLVNDSSIVVKFASGTGDGSNLNAFYGEGATIGIYKNGILYERRGNYYACLIPVIKVPINIENDKINNYVINEIARFNSDFAQRITKIEKVTTINDNRFDSDINDLYTIYTNNNEFSDDFIVIRKMEIFDLIPDRMILDIPEVEYEKAYEMILNNIEEIFKENDIKYTKEIREDIEEVFKLEEKLENGNNITISVTPPQVHLDIGTFHYASVNIIENHNFKRIQIKYNNTDQYNVEDEKYVKDLKIIYPSYYEVDVDFLLNEGRDAWNEYFKIMGEYYTREINDNSIIVKAYSSQGDFYFNVEAAGSGIGIFKNGILYEIRHDSIHSYSIPVINVPNNILEDELNNYISQVLNKYKPENCKKRIIKSIEKGTKNAYGGTENIPNMEDGYTVNYEEENIRGNKYEIGVVVIIRREQIEDIETTDATTNIKLDTKTDVVPKNTILVAEEVEKKETLDKIKESIKEQAIKFKTYDITLMSDGVAVQPNGKVKISIPVPEGFDANKIIVYRIEEDGSKIKYETIVENGYIVFETDHFSIYVLAEKNEFKLGDVNKDGKVNSLDATLILKYVAKKKTLDVEQLKLADVTKDGKVNSLDAVKILKYVAKKITEF